MAPAFKALFSRRIEIKKYILYLMYFLKQYVLVSTKWGVCRIPALGLGEETKEDFIEKIFAFVS